jgi:hypothetical protein
VPHLQHVPLLPETVRRLLLPPYLQTHVSYIKADRQHGAAELAAYVLQAIRAAVLHEERTAPLDPAAARPLNSSSSSSSSGGMTWQPPPLPPQQQAVTPAASAAAAAAAAAAADVKPVAVQPTFEGCMEAYSNFCFQLAQARPSMSAVANAAAEVLLQLQQEVAARADAFEPTAGVAR